jgi:NADP-dependent 3-hydroxy acid dehydrogenase YdfG
MINTLQDKVVVITGASSGIGKALTYAFASHGVKLAIAARSLDKLEMLATELKSRGTEVLTVQTDVSVEEDCKNLIEKTIERFGTIDILLNNAGISMRALFKDLNLDVIRQLMDINFWGTVYCTKYALPYLLNNKALL